MRYWTSDWHINSEIVRQVSHRPWKTAEEMNRGILNLTYKGKIQMTDQIIHVGDLIQSGKDRGIEIAKDKQMKWHDIAMRCHGMLVCVEGNHDSSNDVPFVCRSMKTRVGNYNVTVGHYPTWYDEAVGTFYCYGQKYGEEYDRAMYRKHPAIHICGHVHNSWKVAFDKRNRILNINVGIDAHNYKILSESELVELIDRAIAWYKYMDTTADHWFGDGYGFADWEKDVARQKQAAAADKNAKMMEWLKVNKPEIYAAKMKKGKK